MFSVQKLSRKIDALNDSQMSVEDFEDWFLSESWGYFDVQGDPLSSAIASVHHILHECEAGELGEDQVPKELAAAIRPFEEVVYAPAPIVNWHVKGNFVFPVVNSIFPFDQATIERIPPQRETGSTSWVNPSIHSAVASLSLS